MKKKLVKEVKESFQKHFKAKPILIYSPGRINLIGEHTDYNDGFVFPAATNKGIVTAIQKSNASTSKVFAVNKDEMHAFSLDDISPVKNGDWRNYVLGVIAEIHKKGISFGNFNIAFAGDIPGGAGMSSSAALENSIVFSLNELFDLGLSKTEMIFISQKAEHNYAGVKCGIMDQYASMFGQKKSALLLDCRSLESKVCKIDTKDYKLLLINTNVKHNLSDSAYNDRRAVCEKVVAILGIKALRDATIEDLNSIKSKISEEDYQKASYVIEENNRVQKAAKALENDDLAKLGELIYASHEGLQHKYKVSCKELDFLVDEARKNDKVLGARMMGGGFGGCTINLIHKEEAKAFQKRISKKYKKEFDKNCSFYTVKLSKGTSLISE